MNTWWLSFSLEGLSQGICLVDAESKEDAISKARTLGIVPPFDDCLAFDMTSEKDAREEAFAFEKNKLYSRNEMIERGYSLVDICDDCSEEGSME